MELNMMNLNFTESQKINRNHILTGFVWILLACIFMGIGPLGMLHNESVSRSVADDNRRTDYMTQDLPVIEEFVPQHDFITSIGFVLNREGGSIAEGVVSFKLFDGAVQLLQEIQIPMTEITDGGFTDVTLHQKVRAGETYFYRIEVKDVGEKGPKVEYRSLSGCGPLENKTFYFGSTILEDSSPVSRFTYRVPLEAEQLLTYAAYLIFLGFLITAGITKLPKGGWSLSVKAGEGVLKWLGCLLSAIGITVCWDYLILENQFRTGRSDHIVYGLGLIVLLLLLWYGIWQLHFESLFRACVTWNGRKAASILRTVMFAGICVFSMYYYNSGSNYGHRIATRYSMICFGLAILSFYSLGQIVSRKSLLLMGATALGAAAYRVAVPGEDGKLLQYVLSALVVLVWELVLLRLICQIKEKKLRRMSVWYSVLLLGFFVLLVLFRNTRTWPFEIAFYFTVLYLQDFSAEEWKELLRSFCNGALLSFGVILSISLLFRPYHRYNYSRYPLLFYSVATCALYLTVVFCAALTKLLVGYRKRPAWHKNVGNLFVMSLVFCYTFMTVSRTAYLALFVACVCLAVLLCVTWYRRRIRVMARTAVVVILAGFLLMPTVFTATRSLPAVVGKPYIMSGELWKETILETDAKDSKKYMNVERFLDLTFEKLMDTLKLRAELSEIRETEDNAGQLLIEGQQSGDAVTAAEETEDNDGEWRNESADTASNGRMDIYLAYLRHLNVSGHESMVLETEEETLYHAHNTFLQTAYDHGIFVGIYFILVGIGSLIRSIGCFKRDGEENGYLIFPVLIIVTFGVASLTEWTFHPSVPLAFALLLVQAPLLGANRRPGES